jgi:hypothetical protein
LRTNTLSQCYLISLTSITLSARSWRLVLLHRIIRNSICSIHTPTYLLCLHSGEEKRVTTWGFLLDRVYLHNHTHLYILQGIAHSFLPLIFSFNLLTHLLLTFVQSACCYSNLSLFNSHCIVQIVYLLTLSLSIISSFSCFLTTETKFCPHFS